MTDPDFESYLAHLSRLMRLSRRQRADIRRELAAHVAEAVDDLVARGVTREQAIRQILDDFGDAAELAARFSTLGRKRRWMMHGTAAAACIGFAILAVNFLASPNTPPAIGAGQASDGKPVAKRVADGNSQDDAIFTALRKKVADASFTDMPLEQVLEWFGQTLGTNVYVQWQALQNAGIARDHIINMNLKGVSLERVFRLVLDELAESTPVGYEVQDGVLIVSTRDMLQRYMTTRVYDVRDLLTAIARDERAAAAKGGASKTVPAGASGGAEQPPAERTAECEVSELIRQMIDPESWQDNGGRAQMQLFHGALVVRQTAAVHREVDELIRSLRDTLTSSQAK